MKSFLLIGALTLICSAFSGRAHAETSEDEWQFRLTPYIWLPTIAGTVNYSAPPGDGGGPNVDIGPVDWLELLNFGVLIGGSARKGRFLMFTDIVYLSMSSNSDGRIDVVDGTLPGPGGPISIPVDVDLNLNTMTDMDGLLWTIAAG